MTTSFRYYRVDLTEAHDPSGISSACIRYCMCCSKVLSSMGGGGDYLCQECLNMMRMGEMTYALSLKSKIEELRHAANCAETAIKKKDRKIADLICQLERCAELMGCNDPGNYQDIFGS